MQPADSPAWLVAYHAERGSSVPTPSPPKPPPPPKAAPVVIKRPPPPPPVRPRGQAAAIGIIEPEAWKYDGGVRREPVVDADHKPPRIVRKVGWHHCLKCRRPYFSEDVVRQRMCDPCREDDDRFT